MWTSESSDMIKNELEIHNYTTYDNSIFVPGSSLLKNAERSKWSNIIEHEERLLRLLQLFQDFFRFDQISWLQSKSLAPFNGSPAERRCSQEDPRWSDKHTQWRPPTNSELETAQGNNNLTENH